MSGIVEIELPRFSITPLERHEPGYWELAQPPSHIRGGTWTLFNWERLATGHTLYRVQYRDELRQPQAEVEFEELVAYLLDRGAVPSAHGFCMLRTSGLWTPTGTKLLLSPDTCHSVLKVAPADDSDGSLSLSLKWSKDWDKRDINSLPPYWMRLEAPQNTDNKPEETVKSDGEEEKVPDSNEKQSPEKVSEKTTNGDEKGENALVDDEKKSRDKWSDTPRLSGSPQRTTSVRFRIGSNGIQDAYREELEIPTGVNLNVDHLKAPSTGRPEPACTWFASAATALGGEKGMGLWGYSITEHVTALAQKESVPCGVMVLLGALDEAETPTWATPHFDRSREEQHEDFLRSARARDAERRMPPAQAELARHAREREEFARFAARNRNAAREAQERDDRRLAEALAAPRLDARAVANANLRWLVRHGHVRNPADSPLATLCRPTVEALLYRMVFDPAQAAALTGMLERWRGWTDGGGMNRAHFAFVKDHQPLFAYASCILCLLREAVAGVEGSAAADMQESLRVWSKVRVG